MHKQLANKHTSKRKVAFNSQDQQNISHPTCTTNWTQDDNTWTDLRIEEIKKKYETPTKKRAEYNDHTPFDQSHTKIQQHQRLKTENKDEKHPLREHNRSFIGSANYQLKRQYSTHDWKQSEPHHQDTQNAKISHEDQYKISSEWKRQINQQETANNIAQKPVLITYDNFYMRPSLNNRYSTHNSSKQVGFKMQEYKSQSKPSLERLNHSHLQRSRVRQSSALRKRIYDSRVENIDKINCKINRILDFIEKSNEVDESNQNDGAYQFEGIPKGKDHQMEQFLERCKLSRQYAIQQKQVSNFNQLQQTKILEKQQIIYDADSKMSPFTHQPVDNHHVFNTRESRQKRPSQDFQLDQKINQIRDKYKRTDGDQPKEVNQRCTPSNWIVSQSRNRQQKEPNRPMNALKSSQLGQKIQNLDKKIIHLEEEKRKLNIQFKPYTFQKSPIRKISKEKDNDESIAAKKYNYNAEYMSANHIQTSSINDLSLSKNDSQMHRYTTNQQEKTEYNCSFYTNQAYPKKFTFSDLLAEQNLKMQSHQKYDSSFKQSKSQSEFKDKNNKFYDNEELRRKINERIQQRKKRMESCEREVHSKQSCNETKKLIKALCQQVKLDEELRNSKNWFNQRDHHSKFNELKALLQSKGISMGVEEIKSQFNLLEDENDPFFSFREEKYDMQMVAENYIKTVEFWQTNILHNWDTQLLFESENLWDKLDFERKNYVTIEDLVRFLNMESGNFYRNRDLFLIFDRVINSSCQKVNRIDLPTLQRAFAQRHHELFK